MLLESFHPEQVFDYIVQENVTGLETNSYNENTHQIWWKESLVVAVDFFSICEQHLNSQIVLCKKKTITF